MASLKCVFCLSLIILDEVLHYDIASSILLQPLNCWPLHCASAGHYLAADADKPFWRSRGWRIWRWRCGTFMHACRSPLCCLHVRLRNADHYAILSSVPTRSPNACHFQRCNIGTQWSNIIFCMPLAIANDLQAAAGSCTQGRAMASGRCAPLHKCALDYCPVTCRTCSSPCQTLQGSLASLFAGLVVLLQQMGLLSLIPLCTSRNVGSCRLQTTQGSSLKLKRFMPS